MRRSSSRNAWSRLIVTQAARPKVERSSPVDMLCKFQLRESVAPKPARKRCHLLIDLVAQRRRSTRSLPSCRIHPKKRNPQPNSLRQIGARRGIMSFETDAFSNFAAAFRMLHSG
jgi:hypothetical protein